MVESLDCEASHLTHARHEHATLGEITDETLSQCNGDTAHVAGVSSDRGLEPTAPPAANRPCKNSSEAAPYSPGAVGNRKGLLDLTENLMLSDNK